MSTLPTIATWDEPEGVKPRGTLIVLAGRGEEASVYNRFGRRLAADGYRVRAVRDLTQNSERSEALVTSLASETEIHPLVLVGSDAGALLALRIAAARSTLVAGVITAGLPVGYSRVTDLVDHVELRSACPVHRRVLDDEELVDPHAFARVIPPQLTPPTAVNIRVPVLGLHGDADAIAPVDEAVTYYGRLPDARVAIVRGGRHDVLNDLTHRSVAATVVLFLEELRNEGSPTVELLAG